MTITAEGTALFTALGRDGVWVLRSPDGGSSWDPRPVPLGDGHDPERQCQHTVLAVSPDGGESFLPPVRLSAEESCPDTEANGWTAGRFPGGGDYSGLVAVGPEAFRAAWSDARDGIYRLRTTAARLRR